MSLIPGHLLKVAFSTMTDSPRQRQTGNPWCQHYWFMPPCTRLSRPWPILCSGSSVPLRPDGGGPREWAALGRWAGPRCDRHSRGVTLIPVPAQPPHSAFPSLSLLLRPSGRSRLKGLRHLAAGAHSACREGDWDLEPNEQGFGEEPGKPRRGPEDCTPRGELTMCGEGLRPSGRDPMQTGPTTATAWPTAGRPEAARTSTRPALPAPFTSTYYALGTAPTAPSHVLSADTSPRAPAMKD